MPYQGPGPFYLRANTAAGDGSNGLLADSPVANPPNPSIGCGIVGTSTGGDWYLDTGGGDRLTYSTTGRNVGWNMTAANTNASDGVSKRRVPAGTWSWSNAAYYDTGGSWPLGASATIRLNVFARQVSGGALRYLGVLTGTVSPSGVRTAPTSFTATGTFPEVVLAVGETIHVETWATVPNASAVGFGSYVFWIFIQGAAPLTLPGTGLGTIYVRTQTDSAPATDSHIRRLSFPRVRVETLTTAEALARSQGLSRAMLETVSGTDTLGRTYKAARALIESLSSTEVLGRQAFYKRLPVETVPTTATLAAGFAGTRTIAESVLLGANTAGRQFVGTRALSESLSTAAVLDRRLSFTRLSIETVPTTDALARSTVMTRVLTENVLTVDTLFRQLTYVRSATENLAAVGGATRRIIQIFDD